jgi:adenylosuccinate synthase
VGSGPFPTELHDEVGEQIRQAGREFGSTTGRPRRTGWIDLPALRYAIMLNGVTELHLMKADVLDEFAEIQACTHYRLPSGELTPNLPDPGQLQHVTPEYLALPGWNTALTEVTDAAQFPDAPAGLRGLSGKRAASPRPHRQRRPGPREYLVFVVCVVCLKSILEYN